MRQVLLWWKKGHLHYHNRQKRFGPDAHELVHGRQVKVLVLGAEGVGKTSLVRKILREVVDVRKQPTVYDVYEKEFKEDYGTVRVEVTDMTGKFAFPAMEKLAIKRSDVFVLVYALDERKSLIELERLRKVITETKNKHSTEIPIIVVGTKMDLVDSPREFESNEANTFKDWCFTHICTSVSHEINLYALEIALIQECTLFAVSIKNSLKRSLSGSIIYNNEGS